MIDPQLTLSPRLMISHPITESSKLFFNYGHYRQIPNSEGLYRMQRDLYSQAETIGDPTLPLERTISYELGYDQSLFDQYLLRLSAYYKDISDQGIYVAYIDKKGTVNYDKLDNTGYEDIRGFEFDITKRTGDWITGDFNYEYRVGTSGYFGYREYNENPIEQRTYIQNNPYQEKPRAQPRLKSYIDLHTPLNYGPEIAGQKLLADWHFNFIFNWLAGSWRTWNPAGITGVLYNVQGKDYYNLDLRIQKVFPFKNFDIKFFMDFYNFLNLKNFSGYSFVDNFDFNYYMYSLHLPSGVADPLGYGNIPGDDKFGDYRKNGVAYQPMEWMRDRSVNTSPNGIAIYYEASSKKYLQYQNSQWVEVDKKQIDKIMDDKAYIDMPNQSFFTFLDPRSIFFGLTFTFHL